MAGKMVSDCGESRQERHHAAMTDIKKTAPETAKPEPAKSVPPAQPKMVEEIGGPAPSRAAMATGSSTAR
jgi:hypothetical protein